MAHFVAELQGLKYTEEYIVRLVGTTPSQKSEGMTQEQALEVLARVPDLINNGTGVLWCRQVATGTYREWGWRGVGPWEQVEL